MRKTRAALLLSPLLLTALACAPQDDSGSSSASSGSSSSASAGSCATGDLALKQAGQLTIATDTPAYDPWFADNDPTNGKGFESAVAYAVAQQLGFDRDQVTWVKQPFNSSYAPGAKKWDFDINQVSITPERQRVVDFSEGYYSAAQAVVALDDRDLTPGSMDDLKGLKLGAQTGTTSLTAIRDVIQPDQAPLVFNNTNTAKQALLNGQVDAIVTDLPTAFYVTAAEIEGSEIIGQFQPVSGETEEFGLLLEKGSELTPCVDEALTALEDDGTLVGLEQKWLSTSVDVPVLK